MKKFKIGFEFSLVTPEHGGTFQYSFYMLRLIKDIDEIESVLLFCKDPDSSDFDEFRELDKFKLIEVKPHGFFKRKLKTVSNFMINRNIHQFGKNKFLLKLYYLLNPDRYYFNSFNLDVLHVPWQVSRVFGINAPVIVTIHDLIQLHFPEFFGPFQRLHRELIFTKSIMESDQIISSYGHVKEDVQKYYLVGENKTSVCPVPISSDGFTAKSFTSPAKLAEIYKIPEEFILTPAATWPHKNHIAVLHALKILKDRGRVVYWIATGAAQQYFNDVIEPLINEFGLNEQVQFTDIVSQEDLVGLYKTTSLVVIPTLYEAGSGPLVESMRFGIPVICSNVTTLPENINEPKYVFDPYNYEQMADMIERGLDDESYRKDNIANSKSRIEYYTNFNYKQPILDAYNKAIAFKQNK